MIARARQAHPELPVRRLCALLGVGRSWYYASTAPPTREPPDIVLRDAIERIVLEFPGYGYRRVTHALRREGWGVNHKRVLRVMREGALLCQQRRRFVATTDSGHALRTYPNLAAGFAPTGPDQLWVADITYIPTWAGFLYLAVVVDAWSRRVVGWSMATHLRSELVLDALNMALWQRRPEAVIHHSDQGTQGGFRRSSQHRLCESIGGTGQGPQQVFSSRGSCGAWR